LVQKGILHRIGRGMYKVGEGKNFIPEISFRMKTVYSKLKKEFPYLQICVWDTSVLNEFMHHQPSRFYLLIEVEKDAIQSVFFFLKEAKYPVFVEPTKDILEKYIPENKQALIVQSLVSESPVQNVNRVNTNSLEKILVDIFCDEDIFAAQQGTEMRIIFEEAFTKYALNQNRMLRYADRRRRKESFSKYLNSVSNLRQQ